MIVWAWEAINHSPYCRKQSWREREREGEREREREREREIDR